MSKIYFAWNILYESNLVWNNWKLVLEEMIEIGYWKIRGLVGGVRVLLEHVGEEWKETFYEAHLPEGSNL